MRSLARSPCQRPLSLPHHGDEVVPCRRERRGQAEQNASDRRDREAEAEHARVEADVEGQRRSPGRGKREGTQEAGHTPCEGDTGRPREDGDHGTFDQELSDDAASRGPERQPYADLLAARDATREQDRRHVGAGEQEQEQGDGDEHAGESEDAAANHGMDAALCFGEHREANALIGVGVGVLEPAREHVERGPRLLEADAGPQAAHREVASGPTLLPRAAVPGQRQPEVREESEVRALKILGSDAYDREGTPVESEGLAQDTEATAEPSLPQPVADHGDRRVFADWLRLRR